MMARWQAVIAANGAPGKYWVKGLNIYINLHQCDISEAKNSTCLFLLHHYGILSVDSFWILV